jgi:hypothetical protein
MMLLAMTSPLLGIGLVMVLQVFETWALGPQKAIRGSHTVPPTRQALRGRPYPPTVRTDQMPLDFSPGGASGGHRPLLWARASLCEASRRGTFAMPLQVMPNRNIFRIGLVETPFDLPRTIHG